MSGVRRSSGREMGSLVNAPAAPFSRTRTHSERRSGSSSMTSLSVPSVKDVAGKDADGAVFGSSYVIPVKPEDAINPMHQAFFKAFVAEFGKMPDSQTALRTYDAVKLFAEAFTRAKSTDGTAVRDQLANLSGFEGLAGTFDFRGTKGEGIREARMFAIKNGKDILLTEYLKSTKK